MGTFRPRTVILLATAIAACAVWTLSASTARAKASDRRAIKQLYVGWAAAFNAKDPAAIMKFYSPEKDLVVFDVIPPLQYVGADAYKADWEHFFAGFKTAKVEVNRLAIVTDGTLAFTHSIERVIGTDTSGKPVDVTLRATDCLKKVHGKWLIVHEHVSAPVNLETGKAELNLKP